MARPSSYTPELAERILQRIMDGEMLTKICSEEEMPTRLAFYGWMNSRPDLQSAYARARLAWADWWAERVLAISLDSSGDIFIDGAGKAVIDHANVQRARLQADSIKWLVGKYAPRTYGDKPANDAAPSELKVTWVHTGVPRRDDPPQAGTPTVKQIEYHKPELPADLSEEAWAHVVRITELIKKIAPSDVEPEYVFGLIADWLRQHFLESKCA